MKFNHLIKIDHIQLNNSAGSKKKALECISQIVHNNYPELSTHKVFETLIDRERLGSTGIGHGVALPHGRLSECTDTIGVFVSLANGVDYDAIDKQSVKLLFALLVPDHSTKEHLEILAQLAEFFRNKENRQTLINASSAESVYNILINI
ncbi:MAG: PTS IIA-like nitrogen regulatory protein PtsN [Thiotrichaceae bacterium]|nr:PTS IIA-like nitrogen regulatory protein PtsN [Thiotrichaceae bacterium]